jgi:bacterioferritin-associated ferredoxin
LHYRDETYRRIEAVSMYVCVCRSVTDRQIRSAAAEGIRDLEGLRAHLGVAANCGRCAECALAILQPSGGIDGGGTQGPVEPLP